MRITTRLLTMLAMATIPAALAAQGYGEDPPSRVARLSYLGGSVSFRPASVDDWTAATLNYPLTIGDHLWADDGSRVEMQVGSSTVRMGSETALSILALDDRRAQFRMTQGALDISLRSLDDDEIYEIDTPNGSITLLRAGAYRVDVDTTGERTTVTVREGIAEVSSGGSTFTVRPNQSAMIDGLDTPTYDMRAAIPVDAWESWCLERDRRETQATSARYVSRDMIGYEDLDDYGRWEVAPEYGPVWVPVRVQAGWAPYRYGHWAWVEPWGWTWIDDAPWGFAPFHYGRWAYWGGRWVWVPGQIVRRPVYAPALVAFVGGPGWHVSVSVGNGVAWFPLAPGEVYVPAYRVSNVYVRNINVTNVRVTNINVTNVNVTNIHYANRSAPGAVTVVSRDVFTGARPVGRAAITVRERDLDGARVLGAAPPVVPRRESVLARSDGSRTVVRQPPAAATRREVVVRHAPPPAPVPFSARERSLAANPGRPLDGSTLERLRTESGASNRTVPGMREAGRPASPQASREATRQEADAPAPRARTDRPATAVAPRSSGESTPSRAPRTAAPQERVNSDVPPGRGSPRSAAPSRAPAASAREVPRAEVRGDRPPRTEAPRRVAPRSGGSRPGSDRPDSDRPISGRPLSDRTSADRSEPAPARAALQRVAPERVTPAQASPERAVSPRPSRQAAPARVQAERSSTREARPVERPRAVQDRGREVRDRGAERSSRDTRPARPSRSPRG
jgi:hypothetical protein